MPWSALLSRLRREESGATLIEVLVSAVLVAMLSVGVLEGLDAADAQSGNTKARSVAAQLAQEDQERLRAFRARELSNHRETRTRTVAGVPYTITSRADWVTDENGARSCTNSSARADYLQIGSTVTWPAMRGAKPAQLRSIYAPPNGSFGDEGSLGVQIVDRNASGLPGIAVDITGPRNLSDLTDSEGCVFFGYLPQGNYTVKFSKPGYVDTNGVNAVQRVVGVQNETTQLQTIDYDVAGGANLQVVTKKAGVEHAATSTTMVLGHTRLASPGAKFLTSGTAIQNWVTPTQVPSLFPFTSAYSAYTGNCTGANPADYRLQGANTVAAAVNVSPGVTPSTPVKVIEPSLRLKLPTGSPFAAFPAGWVVKLTAKATGCGGTTNYGIDSAGWVTPLGLPYGIYDVCATGSYSGQTYRVVMAGVTVDNPNGEEVDVPTGAISKATC